MHAAARRAAMVAALALSVACLAGAVILASSLFALLGGLWLIVGLLALDRFPRDRSR